MKTKPQPPKQPLDRYENTGHFILFYCNECHSTGSLKHMLWGSFTCDNPNCDSKTYIK